MGVKIVVAMYVLAGICVSICFWDDLHGQGHLPSETIRNLVLIWGAPLAMFLAVWRSSIAQQQAEIAQKGLLSTRYQNAAEMLGHDLIAVRIGGIQALRSLALEHYVEYQGTVLYLLEVYKNEMKMKRGDGTGNVMEVFDEKNRLHPIDELEAERAMRAVGERGVLFALDNPVLRRWRYLIRRIGKFVKRHF